MDYKTTIIAEFQNKEFERAFFISDVKKSMRYIRYVLLLFCVLNFLLVIYDFLLLDAGGLANIIVYSLIPRSAILLFSIVFFFSTRQVKSFGAMINTVSIFILLFYALHFYMASHFTKLDLTAEALDVIFVVLCIYLVPNRWIINLIVSILAGGLFLIMSPIIVTGVTLSVIIGLSVYLFLIILIISIFIFRINKYKRMQYLKVIQLDLLAQTDPLTKSYNRLKCDSAITHMCQENQNFAVLLFDIDNFKEINDTYGHNVGDKVLVEIVDTTLENIRGIDILSRWGGDEFLIVLNGGTLEAASRLAERLRHLIEAKKFENIPHTVTASFGVTEYVKGDTMYSIVDRADKMLYQVKEDGKNRIIAG